MVENGEITGSDRRRVTKIKKQIEVKKNKEEVRINKKRAKAAAYAEKRGLDVKKTLGLNRDERRAMFLDREDKAAGKDKSKLYCMCCRKRGHLMSSCPVKKDEKVCY